jgi:hypothetical protein
MVSVAEQLGLDGEDSALLTQARCLWGDWVGCAPQLAVVACLADLRAWLRTADAVSTDGVLHELARLGSPTGGDSVPAAGLLAWALLPGACSLARRMQMLTSRIDVVVAAQLWIEVRGFPWQRLRRVAANILDNTRAGVLLECRVAGQLQRFDRTWSQTLVADPLSPAWQGLTSRPSGHGRRSSSWRQPVSDASPAEELFELLEWACEAEVITDTDRSLLLSLVEVADRTDTRRIGRGHGGLMANDVSEAVAISWGVSAATVRRRARRTVQALTDACAEGRFAA